MSDDREEEIVSAVRVRPGSTTEERDEQDANFRQGQKGSTNPSRVCLETSKSHFSNSNIRPESSKDVETAVTIRQEERSGGTEDESTGVTSNVISQNHIALTNQMTLCNVEVVQKSTEVIDSATELVAVDTSVESHQRLDDPPTSTNPSTVEGGISTIGPLPQNFGASRPQEVSPFASTQPPSYTSVEIRRPSIPFIPPAPPPSYGEVMGIASLRSPRPPPLILNVAPSVWTHRAQPAYCRNCHAVVVSKIRHIPCTFTHMAAALLFLFMCWPLCFVPYCVNYCQQTRHHCPGCDQLLGTYSPTI